MTMTSLSENAMAFCMRWSPEELAGVCNRCPSAGNPLARAVCPKPERRAAGSYLRLRGANSGSDEDASGPNNGEGGSPRTRQEMSRMAAPLTDFVIAETRAWVERAVIGLNLCPFA